MQLPRSAHGLRVRHIMRIASHCVPMDELCAYNRNPPFPSLCTPCRGSPRRAVFTLTSAVVKFADDYVFFLSPFLDPPSYGKTLDTHLRVPNVPRCWFEEYRYRTQRYQCHRYHSATLLRRFIYTILRLGETLEKMCKPERISQISSQAIIIGLSQRLHCISSCAFLGRF